MNKVLLYGLFLTTRTWRKGRQFVFHWNAFLWHPFISFPMKIQWIYTELSVELRNYLPENNEGKLSSQSWFQLCEGWILTRIIQGGRTGVEWNARRLVTLLYWTQVVELAQLLGPEVEFCAWARSTVDLDRDAKISVNSLFIDNKITNLNDIQ